MKLVEHYIMRGTRRLVLIIIGFLIFIFASYSAQRYLTEAANGTLALDVVLDIVFYKVLIALEMLLPVGLYVSVGVTLGRCIPIQKLPLSLRREAVRRVCTKPFFTWRYR